MLEAQSLHLIPLPIGENSWNQMDSALLNHTLQNIHVWVAENARTLRRFLSARKLGIDLDKLQICELTRDTDDKDLTAFLDTHRTKGPIGLCSEAGLPCIADPGSRIVNLCHKRGMRIHPYIGPSSILLALSASGLHGQAFTFHGYAPVKTEDLQEHFQDLNKSKHQAHSHLFIEAPYRSDRFLEMATKHLDGDWYLSVSSDLQGENERIQTRRLSEWKNHLNSLGKTPCLFVLGQPSSR
jgi:16S rRNA (cytidine1402-2'-O)-methyltransferase